MLPTSMALPCEGDVAVDVAHDLTSVGVADDSHHAAEPVFLAAASAAAASLGPAHAEAPDCFLCFKCFSFLRDAWSVLAKAEGPRPPHPLAGPDELAARFGKPSRNPRAFDLLIVVLLQRLLHLRDRIVAHGLPVVCLTSLTDPATLPAPGGHEELVRLTLPRS